MSAMKSLQAAIVLGICGMIFSPRACEGFISYTWADRGMYTAGEPIGYDLDFNADSMIDLIFTSTGMWFSVDPQGDNQAWAGGNGVRALSEGYEIGPSVDPAEWQHGTFGLLLNSCAVLPPPDGVICNGEFIQTTAYMGVMFDIQDAVHYGWVRISNPFYGASGGVIMDFAYETEPGVGILAGAGMIPEPATSALLSVGGLLLALRHRRRHS